MVYKNVWSGQRPIPPMHWAVYIQFTRTLASCAYKIKINIQQFVLILPLAIENARLFEGDYHSSVIGGSVKPLIFCLRSTPK